MYYYSVELFICSPSEIRYLMVNLGEKISDEELYDIVRVADIDRDGYISMEGKHFVTYNGAMWMKTF